VRRSPWTTALDGPGRRRRTRTVCPPDMQSLRGRRPAPRGEVRGERDQGGRGRSARILQLPVGRYGPAIAMKSSCVGRSRMVERWLPSIVHPPGALRACSQVAPVLYPTSWRDIDHARPQSRPSPSTANPLVRYEPLGTAVQNFWSRQYRAVVHFLVLLPEESGPQPRLEAPLPYGVSC
jgi:hypothetical protein